MVNLGNDLEANGLDRTRTVVNCVQAKPFLFVLDRICTQLPGRPHRLRSDASPTDGLQLL